MKEWRAKARERLKAKLGGRCVDCGSRASLIFSHVIPLTEEQADYRCRIGSNARLVQYRREAKEGLLTLRCQSCNLKQANERGQGFFTYSTPTLKPF